MRHESKSLCAGRLALALVVALTAILTPAPPPAGAQTPEATEAAWDESAAADGEAERWWGAAGAVICGAEVRLITGAPAIGMNPYVLAAGIAGCGLALLDIMTTE